MMMKIFYFFLKLLNITYEESYININNFKAYLSKQDITYILKNKNLDLKMRIEFIKIAKKFYLDIIKPIKLHQYSELETYISAIVNFGNPDTVTSHEFPKDYYQLLKKIYKDSEKKKSNMSLFNLKCDVEIEEEVYELVYYEINHYKDIYELNLRNGLNIELINEYFENCLLKLFYGYLNRLLAIINNIEVEKTMNLYEISFKTIEMIKFILEKSGNDSNIIRNLQIIDDEENESLFHLPSFNNVKMTSSDILKYEKKKVSLHLIYQLI